MHEKVEGETHHKVMHSWFLEVIEQDCEYVYIFKYYLFTELQITRQFFLKLVYSILKRDTYKLNNKDV